MKIVVDCMSGDKGPLEILKGCEKAIAEFGVDIVIVGKEEILRELIQKHGIAEIGMKIVDAGDVVAMEDSPVSVLKEKPDSSMVVGLRLLHEGKGDAFVSAGNTGALLAGGMLIVKRIPGINRAALAPLLPTKTGKTMLIDSGANVECRPDFLNQFALMGSVYMEKVLGVKNPKIGLANNGTEETKGTELYIQAHELLKANKHINFIGNIEGRGIMLGDADVVVCDGFTGNLILKSCEGAGLFMMGLIKEVFMSNIITKIAALLVKSKLKNLKGRLDYNEIGGAVLLGVTKPIIKAHGGSDANAFKNAIKQAMKFCEGNVVSEIENALRIDAKQKTNTTDTNS